MVSIPIYQVDAFADAVFGGNPAAVCFLDHWLDDQVLQGIAAENNLAETAFVAPSDDEVAHYALRWFTPTVEVDLCGHATLASAFILLTQRDPTRSNVTFTTRGGYLTVHRAGSGYEMDMPARPPSQVPVPDGLSEAIGVTPDAFLQASNEHGMYLAVLASAAVVRKANPDLGFIAQMDGDGLIITAPGAEADKCDFVSRYFAPAAGIPEDPVTGSAHCVLAPYWAERLGKMALSAKQVSQRGGSLACRVEGERVVLSGNTILYLEGTITV